MEVAAIPSAHHKLCSVGSLDPVVRALLARMALPSRVALSALSLRQTAHVEAVGLVASLQAHGALVDLAEDLVANKHMQIITTDLNKSMHPLSYMSSVLVSTFCTEVMVE
jgi:hypothetical protein